MLVVVGYILDAVLVGGGCSAYMSSLGRGAMAIVAETRKDGEIITSQEGRHGLESRYLKHG